MLSFLAKCLLVSTSLSPVLGAVAISQFERCQPWTSWIWWFLAAIVLVALCWALLKYAEKKAQRHLFYIKEFESKDQEILTFLFIYLLPFVRSENSTFASESLTSIYILLIIVVAIAQAGALHFNPVMRLLFGYRFYAAKNRHGVSNLLISKGELRRPDNEVQTVIVAWNIYLHIGDSDA
ncbi:MAG: hypothetical protein OXU79_17880 [Gemmatimonadota bacterium]|nr:hypothetical protein [Gemmatimonadota bacterium]